MRPRLIVAALVAAAACSRGPGYQVAVSGSSDVYNAAKLAARDVNARRPVGGGGIHVLPAATRPGTPDGAQLREKAADPSLVAALEQGARDRVTAEVRAYVDAGVPVLSMTPGLPIHSPYLFLLAPPRGDMTRLMADRAIQLWSPHRAVIIRSTDSYGSVVHDSLARNLRGRLQVVGDETVAIDADTGALASLTRRVAEARPDVIFWLAPVRPLWVIVNRLRGDLPDTYIMASDAVESPRVHSNDNESFNGLVFARLASPADTGEVGQSSSWTQAMVGKPDDALAYDAIGVLAAALRDGARTRPAIQQYLASLGRTRPAFKGLSGPVAFDSAGVINRRYQLVEVTSAGTFAVPERRDTAAAKPAGKRAAKPRG
ncbi:MAG TPA: ABC transporter substrate-binding protein [Longimicrobiales bacterium]|nr:ABC transporter substrate-binding protein [Longimicrobiales bacterium]